MTYFNSDSTEISEEEFNALADTAFPTAEKLQATFSWFSAEDDDGTLISADTMQDDALLTQLQASFAGFSVG